MSSLGTAITTAANEDDLATAIGKARIQKRWVQEIKFYETKSQQWKEKGKKILRRYKDERSPRDQRTPRFNILWSNIQTLLPALYSRRPKPDIERRFRDKDDLGRISSTILERCISYFLNDEFDAATRQAVLDRLLPGRGTIWVRYEPHFKDAEEDENEEVKDEGEEITDNAESYSSSQAESDDGYDDTGGLETVEDEVICFDYVHWEDFGHSFGRTWDEVTAIWRKVYLTRSELKERFGDEIGGKISLDYSPQDLKDNKYDEVEKKATIYEIWDKSDKKVCWVHKDYHDGPLDEQDDPLELTDFWPSPRPLFATLANDTCIPVPDYSEYQDQAAELDEITSRIGAITKAIKVAGVYDRSAAGVDRVLSEGVENQLIPVDQWAAFAEKGGLKGVMELLPMDQIMATLQGLYEARDKVKADLYEITGISDIIRGATDANETATAQQIKSQFGTLRLSANQDDVQRFVRELVKIGTEIIAQHFSLDTIKKICGVQLLTEQDKQLVQMRMQMMQQYTQQKQLAAPSPNGGQPAGQQLPQLPPPQLPPLPDYMQKMDEEDLAEAMDNPTWEEVYQLIRDEISLSYKIDIETDSTIKFDQDAERDARVQFLGAVSQFMKEAIGVPPELAPLAGKMLQFGVRGFKVGKELESAFDLAIHKLEKQAENPQQKPNPEMMKIQGDMQIAQAKLQGDTQMAQAKLQGDMQLRQQELQSEAQLEQMKSAAEDKRLQLQAQVDAHQSQLDQQTAQLKAQYDRQSDELAEANKMAIARLDAETKIAVAQIQAKAQLQNTQLSQETSGATLGADGEVVKGQSMQDLVKTVVEQLQTAFDGVQKSHQQLTQAITKPKQVVRDDSGKVVAIH